MAIRLTVAAEPALPGATPATPIPRPAARVLLIDDRDRVLLFRTTLPQRDDARLWITPGGALDAGETYEQAALRELWEETGVSGVKLGPCVWTRRHIWRWGDAWSDSYERFYPLRVANVRVSPAALDPMERQYLRESRWWSLPEIAAAADAETFVPRRLAELLPPIIAGDLPPTPIETGV